MARMLWDVHLRQPGTDGGTEDVVKLPGVAYCVTPCPGTSISPQKGVQQVSYHRGNNFRGFFGKGGAKLGGGIFGTTRQK